MTEATIIDGGNERDGEIAIVLSPLDFSVGTIHYHGNK